jgi:hypothetical protein
MAIRRFRPKIFFLKIFVFFCSGASPSSRKVPLLALLSGSSVPSQSSMVILLRLRPIALARLYGKAFFVRLQLNFPEFGDAHRTVCHVAEAVLAALCIFDHALNLINAVLFRDLKKAAAGLAREPLQNPSAVASAEA